MPGKQLLTAAIENIFNSVLSLDDDSPSRLAVLQGKVFSLTVDILPFPLVFHFSQRVDVLSHCETAVDCALTMDASVLPELSQPSQLTRLIKEGKLSLEGDIHVAQQFSALVTELNIDLGDVIAPYVGDVVAHSVVSGLRSLATSVKRATQQARSIVSEGAIEEKEIAAPAVAVLHFNDEVTRTRNDVERLALRVEQLLAERKD